MWKTLKISRKVELMPQLIDSRKLSLSRLLLNQSCQNLLKLVPIMLDENFYGLICPSYHQRCILKFEFITFYVTFKHSRKLLTYLMHTLVQLYLGFVRVNIFILPPVIKYALIKWPWGVKVKFLSF